MARPNNNQQPNGNQQPDNNPNQEIVLHRLERQRAIALPNIVHNNDDINIVNFNFIEDFIQNYRQEIRNNPRIFIGRARGDRFRFYLQVRNNENINLPPQQ